MSIEFFDAFRSRMMAVWDPKSLFHTPYTESIQLGFHEFDAQTLDQLGFPSWAAPNIWLHPPKRKSDGLLCLGEDSEDREILYDTSNGKIFINSTAGGGLPIASNILDFLTLLLELAELIEKAIALYGSGVYVDGRMPSDLIAEFWMSVNSRLGAEGAQNSFWRGEAARMSRNSS